eukprot:COSAG05_NODE_1894_length_3885_cov_34.300503_3_plen_748_part_00
MHAAARQPGAALPMMAPSRLVLVRGMLALVLATHTSGAEVAPAAEVCPPRAAAAGGDDERCDFDELMWNVSTLAIFQRDYIMTGRPAVLRQVSAGIQSAWGDENGPVMRQLQEQYPPPGEDDEQNVRWIQLKDVDGLGGSPLTASLPSFWDFQCNRSALRRDPWPESALGTSANPDHMLLLARKEGGTEFHSHGETWNLLLSGQKEWTLKRRTSQDAPSTALMCTQHAGDVMYIPTGVCHRTTSAGDSLAVRELNVCPQKKRKLVNTEAVKERARYMCERGDNYYQVRAAELGKGPHPNCPAMGRISRACVPPKNKGDDATKCEACVDAMIKQMPLCEPEQLDPHVRSYCIDGKAAQSPPRVEGAEGGRTRGAMSTPRMAGPGGPGRGVWDDERCDFDELTWNVSTLAIFQRDYIMTGRPAILRQVSAGIQGAWGDENGPVMRQLQEQYPPPGEDDVQNVRWIQLKDVDGLGGSPLTASLPSFWDFQCNRSALRRDPPAGAGAQANPDHMLLLARKEGGTEFHSHGETWNLLLSGQKEWTLKRRTSMDPQAQDAPSTALMCTQHAGDVMYIPTGVCHRTTSAGDSLAVRELNVCPQKKRKLVNTEAVKERARYMCERGDNYYQVRAAELGKEPHPNCPAMGQISRACVPPKNKGDDATKCEACVDAMIKQMPLCEPEQLDPHVRSYCIDGKAAQPPPPGRRSRGRPHSRGNEHPANGRSRRSGAWRPSTTRGLLRTPLRRSWSRRRT